MPAGEIAHKRYADRDAVLAYFAKANEVAGHHTGGSLRIERPGADNVVVQTTKLHTAVDGPPC